MPARVRNYETTFVMVPDMEEEDRENIINRAKSIIKDHNGEINEEDEWGSRQLAYEINDYKTGYYTVIDFDAETTVVQELERQLNIMPNVLRHLVIKKED